MSHPKIKDYLKFVRQEQAINAVVPSQAVPLFFSKFKRLISFLRDLITKGSGLSSASKYVLARDVTFFVVDFFTGDRASDLGRLRSEQVFKLKDRVGYLLNFTFGKTHTGGRTRPFALSPIPQKEVCPVLWNKYYLAACEELGVCLAPGFFFRALDHKSVVSERPFVGSAVNNRLHKHLQDAGIDGGETPYSFRVGISNKLKQLGCTTEELSRYTGWRSTSIAEHYSQPSNTPSVLSLYQYLGTKLDSESLRESLSVTSSDNLQSAM